MKYLSLITMFLIVTVISAKAQPNFKPGYVVNLKGDTTKGFIDYKEWRVNPETIAFREAAQAATQQLSVNNITAFGVNTLEDYLRYIGPVSMNTVQTRDLTNARVNTVVTDTIFLKLITTGKYLTLFAHTDQLKDRFFVSDGNSAPVELNFYKYFDSRNATILTENTYQQQLQRFVATYHTGDMDLINKVQASEYVVKDLEKVVDAINGITTTNKKNLSSGTATQFFLGLAANVTDFGFKGANVNSKISVFPQLNVGLNVFLNKSVRKLVFRPEINVTGNTADTYNEFTTQRLTFNQITATFLPQFIYNAYNTDKLKAFIGTGLGFNINSYRDIKYYLGTFQDKTPSFSETYMSVAIKAGVTLSKFEMYGGYSQPLSSFVEASVKRYSFQVGLNYFFK